MSGINTTERREDIKKLLNRSNRPIKGIDIAKRYDVSRQVIVQDMALLRAEGFDFISTSRGYMVLKQKSSGILKTVAVKHSCEDMGEELRIILENGGRILDVIVEHSVYGELRANLNINDESDLDEFLSSMNEPENEPLSLLTDGLHLHTIEVESSSDYKRIVEALDRAGYLVE